MSNTLSSIEIKRRRGVLTLVGFAQSPKGKKFIKKTVDLAAVDITDPGFKAELSAAVEKLYA